MEYVSVSDFKILKRQLESIQKEVLQLKTAVIPTVKLSSKEHKELDRIELEMKAGKEKDWRQISRK